MSDAERQWYLTGGLRPVRCDTCGATVLVKKNSPAHTSIQWTRSAVSSCAEFAATATESGTALIRGCHTLRKSIDAAVRNGVVDVPVRGPDA
jgi:DNA-directed RNA polymerase subunit RPC12/RpoP